MNIQRRNKVAKFMDRKTIRKGVKLHKNIELFLYGKLKDRGKAVAYCKLHKCYLEPIDIREKGCNKKNCKYKEELLGDIENQQKKVKKQL